MILIGFFCDQVLWPILGHTQYLYFFLLPHRTKIPGTMKILIFMWFISSVISNTDSRAYMYIHLFMFASPILVPVHITCEQPLVFIEFLPNLMLIIFFLNLKFICLIWSIIVLQCHVSFCCMTTYISYMYTNILSLESPSYWPLCAYEVI